VSQAPADPQVTIEVRGVLQGPELRAVTELVNAATEADGVRPLSEHVTLHLRYGGEGPDHNILLSSGPLDGGGTLLGYAHVDPTDAVAGAAAEIVIHPEHRRQGYGRRLVAATEDLTRGSRLRLWAHGDHPAARALATSLGYQEIRRLYQMRRSLNSPLPAPSLPDGVHLRAFRPGEDEATWLALNARAFRDHPEQGAWTMADLQARMRESWFDAEGFLLAEDTTLPDEQGRPTVVAFHWTKVHGGDAAGDGHGHEPIGEVYVVGVDPDHQGRGLGRAVTLAGLRRLRALGLSQAMLYVEADNQAALAVYRGLGFSLWDTDVMFLRPSV
jgi:mycothiol synthase